MEDESISAEELLQAYIGLSKAYNYVGMVMNRHNSLKENLSKIRKDIWQIQKEIIEIRGNFIERSK